MPALLTPLPCLSCRAPYRSTKMYPNAETQQGMLMLRVDGECRGWAAK
jgi:hypothetical protein